MSVAQIFFGSCTPVAAPLMPVAIVSQFKRGKSTNQIKNRTQLANKSDCCAACQMNETAQRSRSCETTRRISNSSHRIVSCYRTCSTTSKIQQSEAAMYENYFMPWCDTSWMTDYSFIISKNRNYFPLSVCFNVQCYKLNNWLELTVYKCNSR